MTIKLKLIQGGNEAPAKTRAQRERDAKAYWDSLTPEQEAWALQKMGFAEMGRKAS